MLFGGAAFSLYQDWQTPLFGSFSFHIFSAFIGIIITTLAFRSAANGVLLFNTHMVFSIYYEYSTG